MAGRRNKKINAKARNPTAFGRENAVLILRRTLWLSPLISALSPVARALLIELLAMYNGKNNGRIFLSVQDATDRLGFSNARPAMTAFEELQAVGLITCTAKGAYRKKAGVIRASRWRLNWLDDDGERLGPESFPVVDFDKLDKRARKRLQRRQTALKRYFNEPLADDETIFPVAESATLPPNPANSVTETTTLSPKNGRNPLPPIVAESAVHLSYQGDSGTNELELQTLSTEVERIAGIFSRGHPNEQALRRAAVVLGSFGQDEVVPEKSGGRGESRAATRSAA